MKVKCDGGELMQICAERGLGLYDVARLAGVSATSVKKILSGKAVIFKTASRVFHALDARVKIWQDDTTQ